MATIGVTGAAGQLGQELALLSQYYPKHDFVFFDSEELDITDWHQLDDELEEYHLDFMINCAAYTKVDLAETESEKAYLVNQEGPKNLAKYCEENDVVLIHFSSDYVYHNDGNKPLKESDDMAPKGIYAKSKLAGEEEIRKMCDNHLIFRTSWVYSSFGTNFVKNILNATNSKTEFNVVFDQIGCPTYARDLADRVLKIVDGISNKLYNIEEVKGTYNIANSGVASWYDFTKQIFHIESKNCIVHPILSASYQAAAERPAYSVFDQTKLKERFNLEMPYWSASLHKCLKALKED